MRQEVIILNEKKFFVPKFLKSRIEAYFRDCDEKNVGGFEPASKKTDIRKFYTVSGLCCYLGISQAMFKELADNVKTKKIISDAKLKIENFIEENLLADNIKPQAAIILLKYHFGWDDRPKKEENDVVIDLGDDEPFSD